MNIESFLFNHDNAMLQTFVIKCEHRHLFTASIVDGDTDQVLQHKGLPLHATGWDMNSATRELEGKLK